MARVQQQQRVPPAAEAAAASMVGCVSAEAEVEDLPEQFPVGLKVLVVDDDLTCLAVLKQMLLKCRYDVTTCSRATTALSLLRESNGGFHVVLSDVHMPDMDGFRLLELVGLEMDLPVIMMSVDARTNVVMKGIKHGACDYLIKPVRMEELKNIWQHVVRKKRTDNKDLEHSGSLEDSGRSKRVNDDAEYASPVYDGADGAFKSQKKKRCVKEEEDDEEEAENGAPSSSKKPRVVWSVELHQQFVNAVNQLGLNEAVPKRILELMNVPGLTRENVASHLQKFRLYLKRLSGVAPHLAGLPSPFGGPASTIKASPFGRLDFRVLAASGQILPDALAALEDELLGQPSSSLLIPARDQQSLLQDTVQGAKCTPVAREITFDQPLLKCQPSMPQQLPQCTIAPSGTPSSLPNWSGNDLILSDSIRNLAGQRTLQQPLNPVVSESCSPLNMQPSCLVIPSQSVNTYQLGETPILIDEKPFVLAPQSSASFQTVKPPPTYTDQDSFPLSSQSSAFVQKGNNSGLAVQNAVILPSWSLTSFHGDLINQKINSMTRSGPFPMNPNSTVIVPQSSTCLPAEKAPLLPNSNLRTGGGGAIIDYSLLPSKAQSVRFGVGQIVDEGLRNITGSNSYPAPGLVASPASSCTDGNSVWRRQAKHGNISLVDGSSCVVSDSCNNQSSGSLPAKLPDQKQGKYLGFVGKGTSIPIRFAVDDIEPSNNNVNHSNAHIGDIQDIPILDDFGFIGQLYNGEPTI